MRTTPRNTPATTNQDIIKMLVEIEIVYQTFRITYQGRSTKGDGIRPLYKWDEFSVLAQRSQTMISRNFKSLRNISLPYDDCVIGAYIELLPQGFHSMSDRMAPYV